MTSSALMVLAFYALSLEVMAVILLIIPLISPHLWSRFFSSRGFSLIDNKKGRRILYVFVGIMGIVFYDASRTESATRTAVDNAPPTSDYLNIEHLKSRMFRAQRDLYISGLGLFFVFVIYRLIKMVTEVARLDASCTAAIRQAESASRVVQELGSGSNDMSNDDVSSLQRELDRKNGEIERLRAEIKVIQNQSEGLSKDYDSLTSEHSKTNNKKRG